MAHVDWEMKAREFNNCNCDFGCPCQFNSLPTNGTYKAVVGFAIDEGHFGDTRIDGLRAEPPSSGTRATVLPRSSSTTAPTRPSGTHS